MPEPAAAAAMLQAALAVTFLVIPIFAYHCGTDAQRAADAAARAQGCAAGVLGRHGVRFDERGAEMVLPIGIAAALAALAALNATGSDAGQPLSLVFQPILFVAGGAVTAGQVFPVRSTRLLLAKAKADDAALRRLDVAAVIAAAQNAFPWWIRPLIMARFLLVTAGSLAIVGLLAVGVP
jgi:hypothetical protein